jgi:hypothetical protein
MSCLPLRERGAVAKEGLAKIEDQRDQNKATLSTKSIIVERFLGGF